MMLGLQTDEIREQKSLFGVITDTDEEVAIETLRPPVNLFDKEPECGDADMQRLGLNDEPKTEKRNGFWRRQFQQEPTARQRGFDWAFGVVLPVVCFFFDPLVFRPGIESRAILADYTPFAYLLSYVSIMGMIAWLLWGKRLGWFNAVLAGLFAVGSIISLAIGIVLLPFSLIGLIFLIGALGFTPLFTGVIYLRNSLRAFRVARDVIPTRLLCRTFALSALFAVVVPYVANVEYKSLRNQVAVARQWVRDARGLVRGSILKVI
jgi:hypothetical protein